MDTLATIINRNEGRVRAIAPDETVLAAAQRMNDDRIGSLLVMRGSTLVGIVTERDVLTRVVAARRDPATTAVAAVMTADPITGSPETSMGAARNIMREKRIRHLPVCDNERLVGMVSIGDLNAYQTEQLNGLVTTLEAYITSG
jgi:CBS domain-containing protein